MTVSAKTLAQRIRKALDDSGMPHHVLAEYVGMDPTALSKALSGRRNLRSLEVALMAERLGIRTDVLFADEETPYPVDDLITLAGRIDAGAAAAVKEAVSVAERMWELDRLLDETGHRAPDPVQFPPIRLTDAVAQGNALAADLRDLLGIRAKPLPTDLEALVQMLERRLSLDVCITPLPKGIDGLSVTRNSLRLVLVSSTTAATRQRFTLAHELCHIAAGDAQNLTIDEDVLGRETLEERRANSFAASFLMPKTTLRASINGRLLDENVLGELLGQYRVSLDALAFRLHNAGIVKAAERDRIRSMSSATIARRPGRTDDLRARNERRPPSNLLDRAFDAYTVGDLGIRPLASLIGADPDLLLDELSPPRFPQRSADASDKVYAL